MLTHSSGYDINPKDIRDMILGLDSPVELYDGRQVPAINLDNAATTPAFKQVAAEITQQLLYYGSIGRGKGQKSEHSTQVYESGRDIVKSFVGADSDIYEVFYVNNTTDGMNKLASALIENPCDMVLTTRMEHHANDLPWRERAQTVFAEVDDKGRLTVAHIEEILRYYCGRIKLVSVTAASNVTGYVNDVHRIAKIAHRYGARIVVDGAQIVAHRPFSMLGKTPEENIDFFVFSAHKMYSPYGGGAVVGLADVLNRRVPQFYGGGMVDAVCDRSVCYSSAPDLYEAGSPNYPGVVGMLKSIEILRDIGFDYIEEHEQRLLRLAIDELRSLPGVTLYGDSADIRDRVGILVFTLAGIDNEEVAEKLAGFSGIAVRQAAFCAHPYVRRLTRDKEGQDGYCRAPRGMVRASFGIYNNEEDVKALVRSIRLLLAGNQAAAFVQGMRERRTDRSRAPNDRG